MLGKGSGWNFAPAFDTTGVSRQSAEQVEDVLRLHGGEEFLAIVLFVGENQGLVRSPRGGTQDFSGHVQQVGAGLDHRLGRRAEAKTDRLAGVTIRQEKGLRHLGWFLLGAEAVPAHLTLAVAGHAVRVQGQEGTVEVSARAAQFAQGNLQLRGRYSWEGSKGGWGECQIEYGGYKAARWGEG
jgi:hypothetical protein